MPHARPNEGPEDLLMVEKTGDGFKVDPSEHRRRGTLQKNQPRVGSVLDVGVLRRKSVDHLESPIGVSAFELDADGSVPTSLEGDVRVQPYQTRIGSKDAAFIRQRSHDLEPQMGGTVPELGIGVVEPYQTAHLGLSCLRVSNFKGCKR